MKEFLERNWGFVLQMPEGWSQSYRAGVFRFFPHAQGDENGVEIPEGHLLLRPDWIFESDDLDLLWQRHVGAMAGLIGAKKVGAARLRIGEAQGLEAEVILPKKENKRLWLAILVQGPVVINMVVEHHIKDRAWFEPQVSAVIASLRFAARVGDVQTGKAGLPLPDGYVPVDPQRVIADIGDPSRWEGYTGPATAGALQAFYFRETTQHGWKIGGYTPFPSRLSGEGFARFELRQGETGCTLGIMPGEDGMDPYSPANIIIRWG